MLRIGTGSERLSSSRARHRLGDDVIAKAFVTAILLTRSAESAEAAVLDSIQSLSQAELSEDLLQQVAINAVTRQDADRWLASPEEAESVLNVLPAQLQRVLSLPSNLRRCFVLRLLMGTTRDFCARVLEMAPSEVDHNTVAAIRSLPISPAAAPGQEKTMEPEQSEELKYEHRRIEYRAYWYWQERGSPTGSPDEDWFRAEKEYLERNPRQPLLPNRP
jgi:hypothetical protein